jgi:F0F1-type ATP synthase assembly protein I
MIGTIIVTAWLGNYVDKKIGSQKPIFTLILMLIGVTGSIYLFIRSVNREKK